MKHALGIRFALGWRRRGIAACSGAIGALALAPVGFWPAIAAPLVVGVWLLDGSYARATKSRGAGGFAKRDLYDAAEIGWWIGFGYFVAGLWWLGAAFLVDAEEFAWALPLGVAGLPAVLGCFTALGFVCARSFWSSDGSRLLVMALSLGASEWLRGVLFTGFPWNALGMALGGNLYFSQSASLVGLHGLTLLTALIFSTPALIADRPGRWFRWAAPVTGAALLAVIAALGWWRLAANPTHYVDGVRLRIMQPNTPQDDQFRAENRDRIIEHYLRLSSTPGEDGAAPATHVIWPESAFPFFLARDAAALDEIARGLKGAVLITGAARVETLGGASLPGEIRKVSYFNAVQVVGPDGRIHDSYDKVHLVPFGEYLPFSGLLESLGLRQFVHIPGGFDPGERRKLLQAPGLPKAVPMICYEAIFPGVVEPEMRREAGWIVNVTNDGWFGLTAGPYQHLAQARLRAIEEALPLFRAANTGISAVIDPFGRMLGSLPLASEGALDSGLPAPADPTFYSRWPLIAPLMLYGIAAFLLVLFRNLR